MSDLLQYEDNMLAWGIHWRNEDIKKLQDEIVELKSEVDEMRIELDRRKLEAFWRDHIGLRLEVGDKLIITQELKDYKQKQVRQGNTYRLGEVYEVDFVNPDSKDMPIRIATRSSSTSVSLDIARHMREAYLQQERVK